MVSKPSETALCRRKNGCGKTHKSLCEMYSFRLCKEGAVERCIKSMALVVENFRQKNLFNCRRESFVDLSLNLFFESS
jgi:hypothetical protein